jgi:hypothetical protein
MISVESNLIDFVEKRLNHMIEAPSMWGSTESVELQVLQLLEIRSLVLGSLDNQLGWQHVQIDYERFIAKQFPDAPPTTLTALLGPESDKVIALLAQFVAEQLRVHSSRMPTQARNAWEVAMIESIVTMQLRAAGGRGRDSVQSYDLRPVKVTDKVA